MASYDVLGMSSDVVIIMIICLVLIIVSLRNCSSGSIEGNFQSNIVPFVVNVTRRNSE